ncbi:MAG: hypothetical protein NXI18_19940 [Alphaproteobacteria bacterium]|nr:hypothetical protein [Alphaproteobacteria bacterium]
MSHDHPPRRVGLDFSGIANAAVPDRPKPIQAEKPPSKPPAIPSRPDPGVAATVAVRAGFTPRTPEAKVDGRKLRAKGRTKQLNIKVTPELHAEMIERAQGFDSVADYLEHLVHMDRDRNR